MTGAARLVYDDAPWLSTSVQVFPCDTNRVLGSAHEQLSLATSVQARTLPLPPRPRPPGGRILSAARPAGGAVPGRAGCEAGGRRERSERREGDGHEPSPPLRGALRVAWDATQDHGGTGTGRARPSNAGAARPAVMRAAGAGPAGPDPSRGSESVTAASDGGAGRRSDRVRREPGPGLGREGSSGRLRRTAGRPGQGRAGQWRNGVFQYKKWLNLVKRDWRRETAVDSPACPPPRRLAHQTRPALDTPWFEPRCGVRL